MAVDALMRKLKIPSKFVPYLEKHRIYELFYDIGNELAMSQPEDPLLYIKECLQRMGQVRDTRLVVILASPDVDRIKLAQLISAKTGYGMLTRYIMSGKSGNHLDPLTLAVNTAEHIRCSDKEGWILVDYPQNKEEAKMLIKHMVIPTHTFLLVPEDQATNGKDNLLHSSHSIETSPSVLIESDISMFAMKDIFKSSLKLIRIENKRLEDIASLCVQLTRKMLPRHVPKLFRIALIGPKGSRRKTIAKMLQEKYNLIHVDIFDLINAARRLDNDLGDEIRHLDKFKYPYSNKLVFDLLKSRLYKNDCLEKGYVLTNYPRSREDFVLLDHLETPPNKVIFFDIDSAICKNRLGDRVVNMYTGTLYSKKSIKSNELLKKQTLIHPDDDPCVVEEELKFYNNHVSNMMDYCGKTGFVIDAAGPIKALFERIEHVLISPAPTAGARSGRMDKARISISKRSSKTVSVAATYPIPYMQQVVPLIDSEELINRFTELKTHFSITRFSESTERFSKSLSDINNASKRHDAIQNESFENIGKKADNSYCTCSEPELGDEDNNRIVEQSSSFGKEEYCTCDEPLIVDENSNYTFHESHQLDKDFCTCEDPLYLE